MSLSLANMLARVKRIVPTTTLDTELQDHILERMNYLFSLDVFPFQEKYQSDTLVAGTISLATADNFAIQKSLILHTAEAQRPLTYLDPKEFDSRFPNPATLGSGKPTFYTIKVAEGYYYFDCPADAAYTLYNYFYAIPDDATDTTISQMSELAKLTVIHWAAADGFADMKEYDRGKIEEGKGNQFLIALKRRYQLSIENDARFISQKEHFKGYRGY